MIAQGYKEVKKELGAAIKHLELHRAAPFERAAAADDEGEIVGSQLGVRVRSVGIRVSRRCEDSTALDTGFWCCQIM